MGKLLLKCINSERLDSGSYYSKFSIDSLDLGQGITIANQLRRVLLGELGKKAITAVSITGIKHEFAVLPGVREDILEILLNLKGIVVSSKSKDTEFASLKVQGPAIITADLIKFKGDSKIINPNHYIATLSENYILEFEFQIEYGIGYKLNNPIIGEIEQKDFLSIDAIFMPVRKVEFQIDNIYDKEGNITEQLFLEIWTDGSILPIEAVKLAANNIISLYTSLIANKPKKITEIENTNQFNSTESYHDILIEELQLSVRSYNCLKKAQISNVGDLLKYSPKKLLEIRNFGRKSANEVFFVLKNKFGIIFKDN